MTTNTVGQGKYEPLLTQGDFYGYTNDHNNDLVPKTNKSWDYMQNLDQFFKDIYVYHQFGGLYVLFLAQFFWFIKIVFIVSVTVQLSVCTNWTKLSDHNVNIEYWSDVFIPPSQCWASLPPLTALFVSGSVLTILFQLVYVGIKLGRFWQVSKFCTNVLNLPTTDAGLADLSWSEIQHRLLKFQKDFQLCVYKLNLDELDIYNRILRHTNYLIAMVNRDIIPLRFSVPFNLSQHYLYFPNSYLFNLKLILFRTPWSPFQNYWQLRADYKWVAKRHELAAQLAVRIRLLGLFNLLFCPIIFVAQMIMILCTNAERFRYQPNSLFGRQWSNYARLYLRHFNELRHEFMTRISQAYIPASRYLDSFSSRFLTAFAETCVFICGGVSMAFLIASMVRDQMMHLPGFIAILVGGGILARASNALIPDENVIYCPKNLLISTLMRIHYMPDHWKENAGTHQVRFEFSQLFQYRMVGLIEELLSPIFTPIILLFFLPNYTLEIVDFLRNYTVEVPGVGDVCSFAQLDIRRHGDPLWHPENDGLTNMDEGDDYDECNSRNATQDASNSNKFKKSYNNRPFPDDSSNNIATQICSNMASVGKTELSLMHFHLTNPTWRLPPDRLAYLKSVRQHAIMDFHHQRHVIQVNGSNKTNQTGHSSNSGLFSTLYGNAGNLTASMHQSIYLQSNPAIGKETGERFKNISHLPGSCLSPETNLGVIGAMIKSMYRSEPDVSKFQPSIVAPSTTASITPQSTMSNNVKTMIPSSDNGERKPGQMIGSQLNPMNYNFSLLDGPTPVAMSFMATSALNWVENPNLPFYQPYNSQTEDGLYQQLGINHSLMGSGRLLTDVLTADISVSALYMHELYHRKLQQRRSQNSGRSSHAQRSMIDDNKSYEQKDREVCHSYQSSEFGLYSSSGFTPSYQTVHSSFAPSKYNMNQYSSRGYGHQFGVDEHSGSGTSNYNEGGFITGCEPGIIRTPMDGRRIPGTQFADVREEDETVGTPRSRESAFIPRLDPLRNPSGGGGIVTLPGSPSFRSQTPLNHGVIVNSEIEADAVQVWPDLPPTNC